MGNPKKNSKDFVPNHIGTQSKKLVAIKESKCKTKRVNNRLLITVKKGECYHSSFCDEFLIVKKG